MNDDRADKPESLLPWAACRLYALYFAQGDTHQARMASAPILERLLARLDLPSDEYAVASCHATAIQAAELDRPEGTEREVEVAQMLWEALPSDYKPLRVVTDWSAPPPAHVWLVDGWLSHGRVALLGGRAATGKSKLAIMLAYALATGADRWCEGGPAVTQSGVAVFASWEDDRNEFARRLLDNPALTGGARGLADNVGNRLQLLDLSGRGSLWEPERRGLRSGDGVGELTRTGAALRDHCEGVSARLLVVDPLAAAFGLNENNRGAVRDFMSSWDRWARDTGCSVLLVAHPPKGGEGVDARYSGSTDWRAAARAVVFLEEIETGDRKGETKLTPDKVSYGPRPKPLRLDNWRWWKAAPWEPDVAATGGNPYA